jgi:hypothetical protein
VHHGYPPLTNIPAQELIYLKVSHGAYHRLFLHNQEMEIKRLNVPPLPGQQKVINDIVRILAIQYSYVDTSGTRVGKTYIATAVANHYNLCPFIVCPAAIAPKWHSELERFGLPGCAVISYMSLINEETKPNGFIAKEGKQLVATPLFHEWIDKGILLILDEFAHVKNRDTESFMYVKALTDALQTRRSPSCLGVLSAIPIDQWEQIMALYDAIGFTLGSPIRDLKHVTEEDARDIYFSCREYERLFKVQQPQAQAIATKLLQLTTMSDQAVYQALPHTGNKKRQLLIVELYLGVVKPLIVVAGEAVYHVTNYFGLGYYNVDKNDKALYRDLIDDLRILAEKPVRGRRRGERPNITRILVDLERVKVPMFVDIANHWLTAVPKGALGNKIVFYLNYIEWMNELHARIQASHPNVGIAIINAKLYPKSADRLGVIDKFQEPNDKIRILIIDSVASEGIDLMDKNGAWPRLMAVSPSFRYGTMRQASGRIFSPLSRSDDLIRVVYGDAESIGAKRGDRDIETKLLQNYNKKEAVAKAVIAAVEVPIVQLPPFYESDPDAWPSELQRIETLKVNAI